MSRNGINVLSLFDGMSCGQIALRKLGVDVNRYYASEIDLIAIRSTQHNYPWTIQLGDITRVDWSTLPKIDLLLAGSPCQGFSSLGKKLNFEDPRSTLFFKFHEALQIMQDRNPDLAWLLENVVMKGEWVDVINAHVQRRPIRFNSREVSAASRDRLYWTSKPINVNAIRVARHQFLDDIIDYTNQAYTRCKIPQLLADDFKLALEDPARSQTARKLAKTNCILTTPALAYPSMKGIVRCFGGSLAEKLGSVVGGVGNLHLILSNLDKCEVMVRHLNTVELERCHNIPNGYIQGTWLEAYHQIGNGWTVNTIVGLLRQILGLHHGLSGTLTREHHNARAERPNTEPLCPAGTSPTHGGTQA